MILVKDGHPEGLCLGPQVATVLSSNAFQTDFFVA